MKINLKQALSFLIGTVHLSLPLACAVGPKYQRPAVDLPNQYRGEKFAPPSPDDVPFGDLPWGEVFRDPVLQQLMETALRNNKDLRIAAARVERARGQYHWVRSDQFPQLGFGSGISRSWAQKDQATVPPGNLGTSTAGQVGIDLSYQADLWGQYRRGTEAARAELFSSEEFRNNVLITLLSDVAQAYFDLLALDAQLRITEKTVQSRQASLYLVRQRLKAGWVSLLDVRQAEAELAVAAREIPALSRDIGLKENQISLLLGANPAPVPRGQKLNQQSMPPKLPLDLPSALLERRPDIRQSEQRLVAANAKIGEAKALFFPQINLASFVGMTVGGGLLDATSAASSITGSLFQFLFDGGKRKGNLEIAKANFEEAVPHIHPTTCEDPQRARSLRRRRPGCPTPCQCALRRRRRQLFRSSGCRTSFLRIPIVPHRNTA